MGYKVITRRKLGLPARKREGWRDGRVASTSSSLELTNLVVRLGAKAAGLCKTLAVDLVGVVALGLGHEKQRDKRAGNGNREEDPEHLLLTDTLHRVGKDGEPETRENGS